jgi:small conductance mechanosensitive channel
MRHDARMVLAVAPLTDVSTWIRSDGLLIVLYVLGGLLVARFVSWAGETVIGRIDARARVGDELVRSEAEKHRHAVAQVLTWTAVVLVYAVTVILVLSRAGVPLAGFVAPATVAGVALGFGAQRIVGDVLAGFFLITERQYGFGDVIRISPLGADTGVSGTVEELTLRVTRIRTGNGEVIFVPNGQIVQVTNLSRDWARAVVDTPVPASSDLAHVDELLRQVGSEAYRDEQLRPLLLDAPTVMGVESLQVDTVLIRMVARTQPGKQFEVGRELRVRIAMALRSAGITSSGNVATADPTREG